MEIGFVCAQSDLCVYTKVLNQRHMAISMHVNDVLAAATAAQAEWLCQELDRKYGVTFQLTALCSGSRSSRVVATA